MQLQRRQPFEHLFAARFEMHAYLTPVVGTRRASHETERFAVRDERHHAVMMRLQTLREFADRRPFAFGITLDMQQKQID